LLMFDIDHFRRINEMFGSAAGDEALRQVSHCMRETLRENDVAGRLAGDQFSILLPDTTPKGAMAVAARIVGNLAAHQVAPRVAPLSLSFGVVALTAGEGIGETLRRAEQALHEAKRQGRSRVVIATGPIDRPVFTNSRTLGLLSA
jgi:diguanylate cyclase